MNHKAIVSQADDEHCINKSLISLNNEDVFII